MEKLEIINLLVNSKFFSEEYIEKEKIKIKAYKKGQFISDFFDNEYYVGIIKTGQVVVYSVASDGTEINMSNLKEGDIFGISNLFEESALDTILKCNKNTEVVFYPKKYFVKMIEGDVNLAIEYSKYCNRKLQFLLKKIEILNVQSSKKKVIEYLIEKKDNENNVFINCSKEDLGKILGISRASLYRELQSLQNKKCIEVNKKNIKILDEEKITNILYEF